MFGDSTIRTRGTIYIDANLAENVRAVLGVKLEHILRENGANARNGIDLAAWLAEAYIRIENIGGQPIAFIVGKQAMAFGQGFSHVPMGDGSNPVFDLSGFIKR